MNLLRMAGVVQARKKGDRTKARAPWPRRAIAGCLAASSIALFGAPAFAQQPPLGFSENLVFLDPAHGGTDPGAHLGGAVEEKDVTLALAAQLRAALAAKGFSVLSARDGDAVVTADQRANLANHARPLACILLHATISGSGAALAVSALVPDTESRLALPWATAQAAYVSESLAFREKIAAALGAGKFKPILLRASVPPIDSLTCAAVTLEIEGDAVTDSGYRQRIAEAVTQAIIDWKTQVVPARTPPAPSADRPAGRIAPAANGSPAAPTGQPAGTPAGAAR
jgi:N-acetylmuramoyl-L-alanine amidase